VTANRVPEGFEFEVGGGAGLQKHVDEVHEKDIGGRIGSQVGSRQSNRLFESRFGSSLLRGGRNFIARSLIRESFCCLGGIVVIVRRAFGGAGRKRGIDIQLATAETALSFHHYIPNLTNTNQTRLEINPPPASPIDPVVWAQPHISPYIQVHTEAERIPVIYNQNNNRRLA
jgi:hypothetical protein